MRLRFTSAQRKPSIFQLGDNPVTIGRSPKADLVLEDEKASRLHCGIRREDDVYVIKDLNSKNGTFVNNEKVESERLSPGDRIQVGSVTLVFEEDSTGKGATTALHEMEEEISRGKGYNTLLKEIIQEAAPAKTDRPKQE